MWRSRVSKLAGYDDAGGSFRWRSLAPAVAVVAICVLVIAIPLLSADPGADDKLRDNLAKQITRIADMRFRAYVALSLTIAVTALGGVTTLLQTQRQDWARFVSGIASVLVSVLTLVNSEVFPEGSKTLRAAAYDAEQLANEINDGLDLLTAFPTDTDREEARKDLRTKYSRLLVVLNPPRTSFPARGPVVEASTPGPGVTVPPGVWNLEVRSAYADEQMPELPAWARRLPDDPDSLLFVGLADGPTLATAREWSEGDARREARNSLVAAFSSRGSAQNESEALADAVVAKAQPIDNYFTYRPDAKLFRYYTLLRIQKDLAQVDISDYAATNRVQVPKTVDETIDDAQSPTSDYLLRRTQTYSAGLDDARKQLSDDLYTKFLNGRERRKKGDAEQSIALLTEVADTAPNVYLVWFNLALAYDDLGKTGDAGEAYAKAAKLEGAAKDASFWNTYGYFLYRQKRFGEAIESLGRALALEPKHPSATQTLNDAKAALEAGGAG